MVKLLLNRSQRGNLLIPRPQDILETAEMGKIQTPKEKHPLDSQQILASQQGVRMGIWQGLD